MESTRDFKERRIFYQSYHCQGKLNKVNSEITFTDLTLSKGFTRPIAPNKRLVTNQCFSVQSSPCYFLNRSGSIKDVKTTAIRARSVESLLLSNLIWHYIYGDTLMKGRIDVNIAVNLLHISLHSR